MTMTIDELLANWPTDIPMKGNLIDSDGCMCAQGQVLHYIGGMTPDDLRRIEQAEADRKTAELLGISTAHAVLLRQVNDSMPGAPTCVLTEPEKVLGDQAQRVLAFWRHLDRMTEGDWLKVNAARAAAWAAAGAAARAAAWAAARAAAWAAARAAAGDAAGDAAGAAAWAAAGDAARAAAWAAAWAAGGATSEIQGAAVMRERGQPFTFLPMFGFDTLEEIML
jgi:hypothetical protein